MVMISNKNFLVYLKLMSHVYHAGRKRIFKETYEYLL